MKKNYSKINFIFFFLIFTGITLFGQISGTVTINSASPTSGTNYQTFSALATVLNTNGINGPLTVNVLPSSGPYIEQVKLNQITGASATNTITVNGNGNSLVFSGASATIATLDMNGSDYFNFYNLKINALNPVYSIGCNMNNNADYNLFSFCTFSCITGGTGAYCIPVNISQYDTVSSGNNNRFIDCNMYNGYYGVKLGNNATSSFVQSIGNEFKRCAITDFGNCGIYADHQKNIIISHCSLSRPTTTIMPGVLFGMYLEKNPGILCEANCLQNFFGADPTTTITLYGIRCAANSIGSGSGQIVFKNNIISNMNSNGSIYGFYNYSEARMFNNTIMLDDQNSTNAGVTMGFYVSAPSTPDSLRLRNNIIYITRGGTGSKYCVYSGGSTQNMVWNNNWYYMNAPGGSNFVAYSSSPNTTFSSLQTNGLEANGVYGNPNFSLITACSPVPTNTLYNNGGGDVGNTFDANGDIRNPQHPDFGAFEFDTPTCSGAPAANSVTVANPTVCPGAATSLSLTNLNADQGLTYQWLASSTGSMGPWTSIPGATTFSYNTSLLNTTTWYQLVMTCNAVGGSSIAPVGIANVRALAVGPVGTITLCKGQSTSLTVSGANTYSWSTGASSASITVTPTTTTSYSVTGTDTITLCSLAAVKTVSVNECTGLLSFQSTQIKIYPVPASDELIVESGNSNQKTFILRDISGRIVCQLTSDESRAVISLQNLTIGIYFLQVNSTGEERILKVIKQ